MFTPPDPHPLRSSAAQVMAVQGMVSKMLSVTPNKHEVRKLLQGLLSQERVAEAHCLLGMLRQVGCRATHTAPRCRARRCRARLVQP